MKKVFKIIVGCILCFLAIGILYFGGVLIYGSITTFHPDEIAELPMQEKAMPAIQGDKTFSLMTWNLGYGGLGKEMDFFYEGGKIVRPTMDLSKKYMEGITTFLSKNDSVDILLFQEVDFNSKRSYRMDQYEKLMNLLPQYTAIKASNYKSGFVPVPFSEPMGKVHSGMAVFSKLEMQKSIRIATPGSHAWPKKLFTLKRCFIVAHMPISNGQKELVVINVHNSAFGDEVELRKGELDLLKRYLLKEYEAGNYVIAGGDWNQNPPGMDGTQIRKYISKEVWPIEKNFLPADWNWVYDPSLPTNRDVDKPFDPLMSRTTILDYFVTSPNIVVISAQTIDLGFENSDHQPVIIQLKLK